MVLSGLLGNGTLSCHLLLWSLVLLSHLDYSLFTKKVENSMVIVLVYVDDLLIMGTYIQLI